jgi:hypothetical protein
LLTGREKKYLGVVQIAHNRDWVPICSDKRVKSLFFCEIQKEILARALVLVFILCCSKKLAIKYFKKSEERDTYEESSLFFSFWA